jgi:hypothetical protein
MNIVQAFECNFFLKSVLKMTIMDKTQKGGWGKVLNILKELTCWRQKYSMKVGKLLVHEVVGFRQFGERN